MDIYCFPLKKGKCLETNNSFALVKRQTYLSRSLTRTEEKKFSFKDECLNFT